MIEIETFFTTYKNTALAFYSFAGFVGVCVACFYRLKAMDKKRLEMAQLAAKAEQRNEFQAGYFDVQEKRQDRTIDYLINHESRIAKLEATDQA